MSGSVVDVDELRSLSGREAEAVLWDLEQRRRRLEAETIAVLDAVDRSGAFRDDGHVSVRSWARGITRWTPAETTARCRAARMLADVPELAAAFAAGEVPVGHLQALGRVYANPRVKELFVEHAAVLVGPAMTMCSEDFAAVLARWESNADADGVRHRQETSDRMRDASIRAVGDEYVINAHLGTAQGVVMAEIFAAFDDAEFVVDADQAGPGGKLPRCASQRRADALYAIFVAAAGSWSPVGATGRDRRQHQRRSGDVRSRSRPRRRDHPTTRRSVDVDDTPL